MSFKEFAIKLTVAALVGGSGLWLIVGTFTFDDAPRWYVVAHLGAALVYGLFAPRLLRRFEIHADAVREFQQQQ